MLCSEHLKSLKNMFIVFRQWSEGENKQQVNYMCLYSSHMDAFLAQ